MYMQGSCVLCYNRPSSTLKENPFLQIPPEIASSCNKYLSFDIVQTVTWAGVYSDGLIFCEVCYEGIEKLSQLRTQLDEIQNDINNLVAHINQEVLNQRIEYHNNELENRKIITAAKTEEIAFSHSDSHIPSLPSGSTILIPTTSNTTVLIPTGHWDPEESHVVHLNDDASADYIGSISIFLPDEREDQIDQQLIDTEVPTEEPIEEGEDKYSNQKEVSTPINKSALLKTITSADLRPHLEKGVNGFKCQKCERTFARLTILLSHDCEKATFDCETCGLSFSGPSVLKLHKSRTHEGDKPFKCYACEKTFGFKHHLARHIRVHTGEKPFECDLCERKFSEQTAMINHKRKHDQVRYSCEMCDKSYVDIKSLKCHLRVHMDSSKYKCDTCNRAFTTARCLSQHKLTHTKEKAHVCDQCGKAFARVHTLQLHLLTHNKDKKVECEQCDKRFHSKISLKYHISTEHAKLETYICEVCGKSCIHLVQYKNHLKTHSDVLRECKTCGKKFKGQHSLVVHVKTVHQGEKPHKCEQCGQTFRHHITAKRHRLKHLDESERPVCVCDVCKKVYQRKCQLFNHQLIFHNVTAGDHVPCEKCDQKFIELGGYEWHKIKYYGCSQLRCRKCKDKADVTFTTYCDFFSHFKDVHRGKGNSYKCKTCKFTMPVRNVKNHHCIQSEKAIDQKGNRPITKSLTAKQRKVSLKLKGKKESKFSVEDHQGKEVEPRRKVVKLKEAETVGPPRRSLPRKCNVEKKKRKRKALQKDSDVDSCSPEASNDEIIEEDEHAEMEESHEDFEDVVIKEENEPSFNDEIQDSDVKVKIETETEILGNLPQSGD